jgi:hypothetical protein
LAKEKEPSQSRHHHPTEWYRARAYDWYTMHVVYSAPPRCSPAPETDDGDASSTRPVIIRRPGPAATTARLLDRRLRLSAPARRRVDIDGLTLRRSARAHQAGRPASHPPPSTTTSSVTRPAERDAHQPRHARPPTTNHLLLRSPSAIRINPRPACPRDSRAGHYS